MTTYNGENYVIEQLRSILPQLGDDDELLIFDDRSSDKTTTLVRDTVENDDRVRVHINPLNLGHLKNFEQAILHATGDVVVLSDQDDIWFDNKLEVIRRSFADEPNLTMFHHSFKLIDSNGVADSEIMGVSELASTPPIKNYNDSSKLTKIVRLFTSNHYYGCCMAFKKIGFDGFPSSAYAHDHYLALMHLMRGKVVCSECALINYRIHNNNVTPKKVNPLSKKIGYRIKLLKNALYILCR
ncbi:MULTISPECIES: glycosyltransferase [Vibrio]|uniref:glycosyltransferase n=1 Tax=Vibrio TaxID=662 RepID=UPI00148BB67E|nr:MULTISPECIES: glycosyltransferase [Vibrio]NOI23988.1 glycosyltransferase [Vibrio mediterranei]